MSIILTQGSRSVTLRNPDFGDTDTIESRRIQRKNRGGDLIMYRDPQWPKTETLTFEFSYLKRTDLMSLLEFIKATLGQNVVLTDYNGRTFTGIIITPSEELAQAGRENFTAKFSFQVEL
jgi:hypothetical protein